MKEFVTWRGGDKHLLALWTRKPMIHSVSTGIGKEPQWTKGKNSFLCQHRKLLQWAAKYSRISWETCLCQPIPITISSYLILHIQYTINIEEPAVQDVTLARAIA